MASNIWHASDSGTYVYECFKDPLSQVRLLQLQPGKNEDEIVCTLQSWNLVDVRTAYTCLSYTWGTDSEVKRIVVNQKPYLIRPNLWNFFHTARRYGYHDSPLWIDAVCINQNDDKEKGKQISIMGSIYQQAQRVIVWLGLTDADTLRLLALQDFINCQPPDPINYGGEDYRQEWDFFVQALDWTPFEGGNRIIRLLSSDAKVFNFWRNLLSYRDLFKVVYVLATYWTRAWIIQEFCLGNNVCIMSPNRPITAEVITQFAAYFRYIPENPGAVDNVGIYEESMLKVCDLSDIIEMDGYLPPDANGCSRFHRFLDLACRRQCYNPRDRIYSILSMLRSPYAYPINYKKTLYEELWDVTMYILVLEQSLSSESLFAMSPAYRALFTASLAPLPGETIWNIMGKLGGFNNLGKSAYIVQQTANPPPYFQGPALEAISSRNAHWSLCIPHSLEKVNVILEFHAEHYGVTNTPDPQLLKVVIWADKGLFWEANVRDGYPDGEPLSVMRFRQSIKEAPPLRMWQVGVGRLYETQVGKKHQMRYVKVEEALAMGKQEKLPLLDATVESLKGYFKKV